MQVSSKRLDAQPTLADRFTLVPFMGGVCAEAVRALREESSNEVFQVVNRKMHQKIIKQCKTLASDLPVDLRSSFDVSALQQRSGLEIDE